MIRAGRWAAATIVLAAVLVPGAAAAGSSAHRTPGPVIVLDPGHSVTIHARDKTTGLITSDYQNEPEMRDVWAVALLVRTQLLADGYRVVMTKTSLYEPMSLGHRAWIAHQAHAALAVSIHDEAGPGGVGFRAGNNIVYYQSVGTYRATPSGHRVYFTNRKLAAISKKYGLIFGSYRRSVQDTHVTVRGNTGYNLGSRGLAPGDIWMVQLLSGVPWIYDEAGGNSRGRSGLSPADERTYAKSIVKSIEHCVPIRR